MSRSAAPLAPPAHRALVPVLVFVGMVAAIGSSLGAPLIPTIAALDHVSIGDAQWSLTITFLLSAVATPTMGRLGDGPHRRTVLLASLAVVILGGVLVALPTGFAVLLVGRALQGVGLGLIPMAITVVRDALPPERAKPAVAALSITTVAGVGLGYPITAVIAQHAGLHTAFWFGAAFAALALVLAARVIPSSKHLPATHLDLAGALLLGLALAGLLLGISEGESWGWTSVRLIGVLVAAVAVGAAWVVLELHRAHPLVDLRLLRQRVVLTADLAGVLTGVGMYLLISLVTRFVETPASTGYGPGGSIAISGLMLTPFSIGSVAASRVTRAMVRRFSPALVLPVASAVLLGSMVLFAYARGSLWDLAVVMGIAGLGVGAIFAVMPGFIVTSVPVHETGSALSFNQVLRYIGYGLGSTLSAVLLQAHTAAGQTYPADRGYTVAGLFAVLIWLLTGIVSLVLPRLHRRRVPAQVLDAVVLLEEESAGDAIPYPAESGPAGRHARVG